MLSHNLIRALQCVALGNGGLAAAADIACSRFGPASGAALITKGWVVSESAPEALAAQKDFLQLAARRSIVGQINAISAFRRTPFDLPVLEVATGATAVFFAQGDVIPVSALSLDPVRLPVRSIAGISLITQENARAFNAESSLTADLVRAEASGESSAFFSDVADDGTAPGGVLHGVSPGAASSTGSPSDDIDALLDSFEGDLSTSVILTSPRNGARLYSAGFIGAGARGGEVAGIAHVTNLAVDDDKIAIVDASRILLADAGEIEIAFSRQTSLNIAGQEVSLYEQDLACWRILRTINWRAAAGAVAWVTGCAW